MLNLGQPCPYCQTILTKENSHWLPNGERGEYFHHDYECKEALVAQRDTARVLLGQLGITGQEKKDAQKIEAPRPTREPAQEEPGGEGVR